MDSLQDMFFILDTMEVTFVMVPFVNKYHTNQQQLCASLLATEEQGMSQGASLQGAQKRPSVRNVCLACS